MFKRVLILCQANICRSPAAAALWQQRLGSHGVTADSAGITAQRGLPAAAEMIELARQRGLDLTQHRSKGTSLELVQWADLILVMDEEQKRQVGYAFPQVCGKVHLLGKWEQAPVLDPYRKSLADYEDCFASIEKHTEEWCKRLGIR